MKLLVEHVSAQLLHARFQGVPLVALIPNDPVTGTNSFEPKGKRWNLCAATMALVRFKLIRPVI